jgi:4-hydroxyphenylpyruvate dioxygenase-like putative hemolysin
MYKKLVIGLVIVVVFSMAKAAQDKGDAASKDRVTLLGALSEWMYPKSNFGGAEMSDGGNRTIQSVKCQALMTTGDSFEKVTNFYEQKFVSGPQNAGAAVKDDEAQSVSSQDDSAERPVQLRVIIVNRAKTSTTLVISRTKGEAKTHIAWSHFVRLSRDR